MEKVHFSNTQNFPPNNLTFIELLNAAKNANPQLIEYFACSDWTNDNQLCIKFRLVHIFKEFRIPQIQGDFIVNSKRNDDGSVEYSVVSTIERDLGKLECLSISISPDGTEINISGSADLNNDMPRLVITGAKRILKLAMRATSQYIGNIPANSNKNDLSTQT